MKLIFISDTHNEHEKIDSSLLKGDVLIHCGDFMTTGLDESEARGFLKWFSKVGEFTHRILIAGNHERLFEESPLAKQDLLNEFKNITYLQDSFVIIEGLKIYGTPYQPTFRDWAFNLPRGSAELNAKWEHIPEDTDILLTHSPPYGVLDMVREGVNIGCKELKERVMQVKPTIHAFGHIHECPGIINVGTTLFINAAQVDRAYKVVNKPIIIEWSDVE